MRAAFLDRDGIVNRDHGYVYQPDDFIFMDGIFELLKFLKEKDFLLFLVTNQSGIGMGYYTEEDFKILTQFMQKEIKKELGFNFNEIYFCPHRADENCLCRKPKPGMIKKAIQNYRIDLDQSLLIGDRIRDVQSAQAGGVKIKFLVDNQENDEESLALISHLYRVQTLKQIPDILMEVFNGF